MRLKFIKMENIIEKKLIEAREKMDWGSIIISAIKNPQNQTANFEELREKAIKEDKGSGEKIFYENDKVKVIIKIKWDKNKFFFSYTSKVWDKISKEMVLRTDESHNHNPPHRHLHSGGFIIPNPKTLREKIEHPILSLIINSETEERKSKWIDKLANELKDSQINWVKHTFKK